MEEFHDASAMFPSDPDGGCDTNINDTMAGLLNFDLGNTGERSQGGDGSQLESEDGDDEDSVEVATSGVIKWESVTGNVASTTLTPPQMGGCVITESGGKKFVLFWTGTDPDDKTNIFGVDVSNPASLDCKKPSWICNKQFCWHGNQHRCQKGPTHVGQFRPSGAKAEKQTQEACTHCSGAVFEGLSPSDGKAFVPVTQFQCVFCDHFIKHGMFCSMVSWIQF